MPSRGARRRQRNARSRWRQWLQSTPAKEAPQSSRSPANRAGSRPQQPPPRRPRGTDPQPGSTSRILNPLPNSATPLPVAPRPSDRLPPELYAPEPSSSAQPRSRTGPPPAGTPSRSRSRQPKRSPNNVTPLRRQPAWTSPDERSSNGAQPPRRGKRRSGRKTPQPVLYGIRLLILGTGIAAIAGTVLSSLNPGDEAALNGDSRGSESAVSGAFSNDDAAMLSQPLPLGEELVSLETDLVALESMTPGLTQSVFFYDLDTGNYIDLNGSESMAAASTIKVPILVAFLQAVDAGALRLDQAVTLREELVAGGSGELQTQEMGTQFTALEVATAMIVNSDNTATNMIIDLLGGLEVLNQQFQSWGLTSTSLRNMLPDLEGTNTTSAADLVRVMALIDQGELLSPRSRDRLFSIMQRTDNRTLIPDGLADPTALAYNKTGDIGTLLGDIALVDVENGHRYILGVLVDRPFNDGRASELVRRVSGRVHEEMSQPISPSGPGTSPTPESTSGAETTGDYPVVPATEVTPTEAEAEIYEDPDVYDEGPETFGEPGDPLSSPELPPG